MFEGTNTVVIDVEVARSPDDCRYCGHAIGAPQTETMQRCVHVPIGWDDKKALGISIGCAFDYLNGQLRWFDSHTLPSTMAMLLDRQPLIISFNGWQFDGPLLLAQQEVINPMVAEAWQNLWFNSYDMLREIWAVVDRHKSPRGVHTLDALCRANGLGEKTGSGAEAPRLWRQGRYAELITYLQHDILLTKALAEHIAVNNGHVSRSVGPLRIRHLCQQRCGETPRIVQECGEREGRHL